tara:strand:- start:575 stop:793 length:219 start_codon:yes stop_codon:yes gene_type:complete
MKLIQRVFIVMGIIAMTSCNHQDGRSSGSGRWKGNANGSDQPQDGSLIVTPEGTRKIKMEREQMEEDSKVEN